MFPFILTLEPFSFQSARFIVTMTLNVLVSSVCPVERPNLTLYQTDYFQTRLRRIKTKSREALAKKNWRH